jgi:AraC-like DNA-binding protein
VLTLTASGAFALIAFAYCLLLAIKLLAHSGGDRIANALLATVCFALAAWPWGSFSRASDLYLRFPHLLFATTPLFFLLGPALLAYTNRITSGTDPRTRTAWLHLTPMVLFILVALPFYQLNAAEKTTIASGAANSFGMRALTPFIAPHVMLYSVLCLRSIRRFEAKARHHFSDVERSSLRWLKGLCIGLMALMVLDVILSRLFVAMEWNHNDINFDVIMRTALLLYIVFLAFSALGYPAYIYKETLPVEPDGGEAPVEPASTVSSEPEPVKSELGEKYARSSLSEDSAKYYVGKLQALMLGKQVYLECELTLRSLAGRLNLSQHHLSQILNDQLGKTFYDYINELRIAHAKRLLGDPSRTSTSILDIAFASGYNNKVSFYNAFKRYVGVTPTRFREMQSAKTAPQITP